MRILNIRTIPGPGVYHLKPTLMMKIDLGEYTDKASTEVPHFTENLLFLFPELNEHFCSPGYKGGFVERLKRGTYPAHIIEHIALALSELCGIGVDFGKSVYHGPHGIYNVIVRYKSKEAMKEVLRSSVEILQKLYCAEVPDIQSMVEEIKSIVLDEKFGPSTEAIIDAAKKRNIPWSRVDQYSFIQLGYGKHRKFIQATTTSDTGDISVSIAQDKNVTKNFLVRAEIKVPRGVVVRSEEEALEAFKSFNSMVVVKPEDGNHGRGVSLKLKTNEEVINAFRFARAHSEDVILEEFFRGNDYRVIVVNGKLVAAAHRVPAHVTGDGVLSVRKLIDKENQNPMRGIGHEKPLTKIFIDAEGEFFLNKSGISLDYVPEKDRIVYLRETANLSTGGVANDVTDTVHPEIRFMCERAARIVGLDVCGIDLILEDIALPPHGQEGGVIEVNAGPGIRMHHYPASGKSRDVGGAIVDSLFPEGSDGRIPIVSITGTNGKTTVTRLVSHILQQTQKIVGTTTTDGIFIGKSQIAFGDTTGPVSAKAILNDPMVEVAVLETARGGIIRRGLGYDWSDVGVITNIQADHIGQDNMESLDDILWVKSLVAECVKPGGTLILNADSEPLRKFIQERHDLLKDRNLILFSLENHLEGLELLNDQGSLFYHKNGKLYELSHGKSSFIVDVKDVPITMNGTAHFQVANVLAAIASVKALNVPDDIILQGLRSFQNSDNPGRLNLYRVKKGYLLLDYGHNPEAFKSVGVMLKQWGFRRTWAVVGAPGDRSDEMIKESGTAAARVFDKIVIREDVDRRGREAGAVAGLLKEAIQKENKNVEVHCILDSIQALRYVSDHMEEDEIAAFFYEDRDAIVTEMMMIGAGSVPGAVHV